MAIDWGTTKTQSERKLLYEKIPVVFCLHRLRVVCRIARHWCCDLADRHGTAEDRHPGDVGCGAPYHKHHPRLFLRIALVPECQTSHRVVIEMRLAFVHEHFPSSSEDDLTAIIRHPSQAFSPRRPFLIIFQPIDIVVLTDLLMCLSFNLTDTLAGHAEFSTDFF